MSFGEYVGIAIVLISGAAAVCLAVEKAGEEIRDAIDRQTEYWKSEGYWPTRKEDEE